MTATDPSPCLPQPSDTMRPPGCPGSRVRHAKSTDHPRHLKPEGQDEGTTCTLKDSGEQGLGWVDSFLPVPKRTILAGEPGFPGWRVLEKVPMSKDGPGSLVGGLVVSP